jgi:putative proteasome-type protease
MLCRNGTVFFSDSRSEMRIYEKRGDRVICILSSGNLSLTQGIIALIDEDLHRGESDPDRERLTNRRTLYETVCYVGAKVRELEKRDRAAIEAEGFDFNIHLIVGGQITGSSPEVHLVYPQGNSIQATRDCPFLQTGERKYGKPMLDRGFGYETGLADAVKIGLISIDATMRSNVSVGPPIDILCYEKDSLEAKLRLHLGKDDPYLLTIGQRWQAGLVKMVNEMPAPEFSKPALGLATAAEA